MGIFQKKGGKTIDLYCYVKVLKVKPVYQQMTLSPKLGMVEISALWHFRLPLIIVNTDVHKDNFFPQTRI